MVQLSYLAGTVIMGALVVAIGLSVSSRSQQRDRAERSEGGESALAWLRQAADNPAVWSLGFFLLVAVSVGGTLLFATGMTIPGVPSSLGVLLVGVFVGAVLAYLCWGVYYSARHRGLHTPAALAAALWMVGLLFVSGIVLRLLEII